jgi:Pyruvate/2-oxoacid:ferredoxin oxidoreductase delta subunit
LGKEILFKEGHQNKKFTIANGVLESDAVISLPKMKTHAFQRITGAVKNQFGCIPGALKGEFHVKTPNASDFAKMLIDLNSFIHPRLYIMDGIMAMEGNGPRGGTPKKMNVILLSKDPIALDSTVCRLMNLDPALVLTNKIGKEMGAGTYLENEIKILGDPLESFIAQNFEVDRKPVKPFNPHSGMSVIKNALVPRPCIAADQCVRCGVCVNMCPVTPKAVDWHDGNRKNPPSYKYDRCIRCYCCQELCPESAIHLKVPLIRKVFGKNKNHEKISK